MLENLANELHQPARKTFPRRKVISLYKDDLWQADLIDLQSHSTKNNGFKYILIVIDTYTKFVWVEALKNKSAKEVTQSMYTILKKNQPKLLQTDNGKEFYNKQFQDLMIKYNIKHYSTYSSIKAGIVERVIRTIKNKIYRHFTATGSWNWYNSLNKIILNYNNTVHKTIKCKPTDARLKLNIIHSINNKNNTKQLLQLKKQSKFKIGDLVRISKYKHNFDKSYTPNWTTEIFTISKVLNTNPVTYKLKDSSNNSILGCFYKEELKKTKFPGIFLIERVLKKQNNKFYVKWMGYDNTYNSWINAKDVLR